MRVALRIVMAAVLANTGLALVGLPTASAQADWQTIQSWPGSGSGTTDPFEASGSELRIRWNVQGATSAAQGPASTLRSEAASVQIRVYQEATPTDTLITTINAAGPGGQSAATRSDSRRRAGSSRSRVSANPATVAAAHGITMCAGGTPSIVKATSRGEP